jgi:sulfur-oxidizing protein SoxA
MTVHRSLVRVVARLVTAAAAAGAGAALADEPRREAYPQAHIDPARGVEGDVGFSDTIAYWRSPQALESRAAWVGDPQNQWKLNWKFMDLDRIDLHPGHFAVDEGEAIVAGFARRDERFVTCLGEGSRELAGRAAAYPKYDAALGRVATVEDRIAHCAASVLKEKVANGSMTNTRISVWFKSLSAGVPIRVDLDEPWVADAYRRGERLFYAKTGQLNFACASCHVPGSIMGHKLRGETPTTPFGDAAHYPTYRTPIGMLETRQQRFARCHGQMRTQALAPGDPAYTDLEVFMTVLSNQYPVSVPSAR